MIVFFITLGTSLLGIATLAGATVYAARRIDREEAAIKRVLVVQRAFDDGVYTADELPDHHIVAWTPDEREAFGVNDTARFIEATDRELRRLERKARTPMPDMPDLSSMRVPGLSPAEEPDVVHTYAWGGAVPIRTTVIPKF